MDTATNNRAGSNAVAVSPRHRVTTAYRPASWSTFTVFGCAAVHATTPNCHKTTRPRPLEPSP